MRITRGCYKDIPAYILDTGVYTATVLDEDGGKIASFIKNATSVEYLLTREGERYGRIGLGDAFERGECSGFDDMFPTIDPETRLTPSGKRLEYPDHGEVCRVKHGASVSRDTLTLTYTSEALGYTFTKVFSESEGGALKISYSILNTEEEALSALFAAHCLIRAEDGGRLILPFDEGEPTDIVSDTSGSLTAGERIPLSEHLIRTEREGVPHSDKFYFSRECPDGFIGYEYPSGERFMMRFDNEVLSCLGVWRNFEGLNGCYCLGLEPATLGYDTVTEANRRGQSRPLAPHSTLEFYITLSIE